jgi:CDP-diacylglycerol pyrophosphatase
MQLKSLQKHLHTHDYYSQAMETAKMLHNQGMDQENVVFTLGDIPKRLLLQRHLHIHVYCGTIHNSQVMETAKMSQH